MNIKRHPGHGLPRVALVPDQRVVGPSVLSTGVA